METNKQEKRKMLKEVRDKIVEMRVKISEIESSVQQGELILEFLLKL